MLAVSALISGMYFGYIFGSMELEDINRGHVELALKEQNYYCYPLGFVTREKDRNQETYQHSIICVMHATTFA